mgnify:CR=1 FL=1
MATLEELIADVLLFVDRPDLLDVARRSATEVLFKCHRSGDYSRDLTITADEPVDESASTTVLTLPDLYRKLAGIEGGTSAGLPLYGYAPKVVGIAPPIGYAGLRDTNDRYRIAGNQLTIFHYQSVRPAVIRLAYFAYPTVTTAVDGTVSTTSWLLSNYRDVVTWRFVLQLASLIDDKAMQQTASAQYTESLSQLLASELVDLPEQY